KTEVMEHNSKQAIEMLEKENDPANLSLAHFKLAIAYNMQGKHEEALEEASIAKQFALVSGDKERIGWSIEAAGLIYCHMGEYWKSFENMIESEQIGKDIKDSLLTSISLAIIGRCFNRVGDPQKALSYYYECLPYA